jgi:hypothetical protein
MFRRKLIAADESCYGDFLHAEDYELWARLARRALPATLPACLMTIRTHASEGISATNQHDQEQMVIEVSRQQIAALPWSVRPPDKQVDEMRRLAAPDSLHEQQLPPVADFLKMFDVFSQQRDIDTATVKRLRRSWIRRVLAVMFAARQLPDLWRAGFFARVLYRDPGALVPTFWHRRTRQRREP